MTAPSRDLDDRTILHALRGDTAALAQLYATYHPQVLAVARRVLDAFRLADPPPDLAAEVWLRLLDRGCRVLRPFDPTRGSFYAFLTMVAWQHARLVACGWRRRRQHEGLDLTGELLEPRAPCCDHALHHRHLVHRMLAEVGPRLSPVDLALLEHALLQQTPMHELAPRLGLRTTVLYKRNERLRARLRLATQQLDHAPLQHVD